MRRYDGHEGEAFRDALSRFGDRSVSSYDLTPGLVADHVKIAFAEKVSVSNVFPLGPFLASQGKVLQNSDGSFPYMPGFDGPSNTWNS